MKAHANAEENIAAVPLQSNRDIHIRGDNIDLKSGFPKPLTNAISEPRRVSRAFIFFYIAVVSSPCFLLLLWFGKLNRAAGHPGEER